MPTVIAPAIAAALSISPAAALTVATAGLYIPTCRPSTFVGARQ